MISNENFLECLIKPKCTIDNYEYYFYFKDEKIKADECSSSRYGRTFCSVNGKTYENVAYEYVKIGSYVGESPLFPLFLFIIIIAFMSAIFKD